MCFIKGNIKKKKGFTLVETIISIGLLTIVMSILIVTFATHSNTYNYVANYTKSSTDIKEALVLIEQEIQSNSERIEIKSNGMYLQKSFFSNLVTHKVSWQTFMKILKEGSTIYVYYKEGMDSFKAQPLLYDVEAFIVEENSSVIYIKIKTKDGNISERALCKN